MSTRAKFKVSYKEKRTVNMWSNAEQKGIEMEVIDVFMYPVVGSSEENNQFFASTPTGEIKLGIVNVDAANGLEVGKSYYVDFTPAE